MKPEKKVGKQQEIVIQIEFFSRTPKRLYNTMKITTDIPVN